MKLRYLVFMLAVLSCSAFAWNCPAGQIRQQAPAGTPTTAPYYDVVEGIAFVCVPTPTTPSTSGSNSTSTSTSGATATGGNSTATGGNSSNTNNNTVQGGNQKQSNSSINNNASTATNNGDNSNNSTEITNIKPAAATAFAPVGFATAPCLAAFGAGAQTVPGGISFGGSRTDKGCDSRATAQQFALLLNNRTAAAKILCTTKAAKRAHLTMEDCLASVTPPPPPIVTVPTPTPVPAVQPAPQITVNVPPSTTEVYYIPIPHETITVTAPKPVVQHAARKKIGQPKPCYVIQDQCVVVGHKVTGEK
jgi:hypothetical protein